MSHESRLPVPPSRRSLRTARLRTDCAKCCGLCCVVPAFDADQGFSFDKPAHTACRNLSPDFGCMIHDELGGRGFPACATFDCYGAGQWVTQHLFGGRSWQSSPEVASRMFTLYPRYRALHELMALLDLAIIQVPAAEAAPLEQCILHIESICRTEAVALGVADLGALRQEVRHLLRASRHFLRKAAVTAGLFN